ncbi:hypothetical protein ACHAPA_005826 [Fusarium lateritium]
MSEASARSSPAAYNCAPGQMSGPGKLVVKNGGYKFLDSYVWGTIHDNLLEMQHIIDQETSDEEVCQPCDSPVPHEDVDLLLAKTSALRLEDDVPLPFQILRLWQVFLERVNPLSKIIHTPTTEQLIINAMANHSNIMDKSRALLFAIYLVSVISLSNDEALATLNLSKDEAIQRFTKGLKTALNKINFLRNYDMVVLQTLVLYLISLRGRSNHDAVWILSGVVIRIAHKMGVHRDGETLGLTPFETEIRRRVWWQIIVIDAMYAVTSGLKPGLVPSGCSTGCNTKIPQNVNDTDFSPDSTTIKPKDGPTDMAFVLVFYEIVQFVKDHPVTDFEHLALGGHGLEPGTPDYAIYLASMREMEDLADELDATIIQAEKKYCDPSAGILHDMALKLRHWIIREAKIMATPMQETPEWGTEVNNPQDNFFRIWLAHNENEVSIYETSQRGRFAYAFKCHLHLDSLLFLAGQLAGLSPAGSFAERTWRLFDRFYYYHEQLWNLNQRLHLQLARLLLKAWEAREKVLLQIEVDVDEPEFIPKLKLAVCQTEFMWMTHKNLSSQIPIAGLQGSPIDPLQMDGDITGGLLQSPMDERWFTSEDNQNNDSQTPVLPIFGFFNSTTGW